MRVFYSLVILSFLCSACAGAGRRPSVLAGRWYPSDMKELADMVDGYLDAGGTSRRLARPFALIAPHAGYIYSGGVAGYSYATVRGAAFDRVIILAPCHRYQGSIQKPMLTGASILDVAQYETPLGIVPVDTDVCSALRRDSNITSDPAAHAGEHSVEIHLPFLQRALKGGFTIVPVVFGSCSYDVLTEIARVLKPYVDEKTLVVASSDFTHFGAGFGYAPFSEDVEQNIRDLDMGAVRMIVDGNARGFADYKNRTGATICGSMPIIVMLQLLPGGADGRLLKYDTSGRMGGSFDSSVSYVSAAFLGKSGASSRKADIGELQGEKFITDSEEETLLRISRAVLTEYVTRGKIPDVEAGYSISDSLRKKRGVFVTLKKKGALRGCIGYIVGFKPVFQAVADNTVNACSEDYRFRPVTAEELSDITIDISVMSEMIPVSGPEEIVVGRDGLYMQKGSASGVLLPQVPVEEGWTRDEFLVHLSAKAGLPPEAWRDSTLFRFTAQVFGE